MTHDDFVSFEQALKMSKLGFDWECDYYYDALEMNPPIRRMNKSVVDATTYLEAPTLTQAAKWLREVKKLDLDITLYRDIDATKDVPTIKRYYNCEIAFGEDDEDLDEDFDTYEQALSAGIDLALEILKEEK